MTDNALASAEALAPSPTTSEPAKEAPSTEQTKDAQTSPEAQGEGQSEDGKKPGEPSAEKDGKGKEQDKKPRGNSAAERIGELTAKLRSAERERDAAMAEAARLKKPLPVRADATEEERQALANRQGFREEMHDQVQERAAEAQRQAFETRKQIFEAKVSAVQDRAPDALAKFYAVPCTSMMADFVAESERAGELAVFLGSNPHEAQRIASLPAARQAIELARIEGRLQAAPEVRRTSQAPEPAQRLSGGTSPPGFDQNKASVADFQQRLKKAGAL